MSHPTPSGGPPVESAETDRLDSWKEIATYLNRDVRTVQRWERREGLPVHRHHHAKLGSVYAYPAEIDKWSRSRCPPVVPELTQHSPRHDTPAGPATAGNRQRRIKVFVTLGVLVILAGAAPFLARRLRSRPPGGKTKIDGLAVLPFQNLSEDPGQDYIGEGISDGIITELGRVNGLRVVSRTSAATYKDLRKPLPEVARALGVDAVVEGTVLRSGSRVRVTAQLIDAGSDRHLWANSYEGALGDVLAFEDEIARAIAGEIQANLTPEAKPAASRRPVDIDAYDAYLKGRYFANKRSEAGLKKSLEYFEQAIRGDPGFAAAYAGMGASYALLTGYGDASARELYPLAEASVIKALDRDDTLAEAHAVLGLAKLYYDWKWADAERELRRAIALQPGYATAHHWLAYYLLFAQRPNEAIKEIQTAEQLDPLSLIISVDVSEILYFERRYDDAIRQLEKALELDPNFPSAHARLGYTYIQTSNYARALEEFQRTLALPGANPSDLAGLSYAYASAGRRTEAREVLARLYQLSKEKHVRCDRFALAHTGLGEKEEAMRWLDKAYAQDERPALIYLTVAPEFDSLRSSPQFKEFMRRTSLMPWDRADPSAK